MNPIYCESKSCYHTDVDAMERDVSNDSAAP